MFQRGLATSLQLAKFCLSQLLFALSKYKNFRVVDKLSSNGCKRRTRLTRFFESVVTQTISFLVGTALHEQVRELCFEAEPLAITTAYYYRMQGYRLILNQEMKISACQA